MTNEAIAKYIYDIIEGVRNLANDSLLSNMAFEQSLISSIIGVANTAVKPIASVILGLVCILEFHKWFSSMEQMNAGGTVRLQMLGVLFVKIGLLVFFVQNIDLIVKAIVDAGNYLVIQLGSNSGIETPGEMNKLKDLDAIENMVEAMNLGVLDRIGYKSDFLIPIAIFWLCKVIIFVVVKGRQVELMVLVALAPLPFITLVHSEYSQIGKNFIKLLIAVSLHGGVIVLILSAYAELMTEIAVLPDGTIAELGWAYIGYAILLAVSLAGSAQLTKRIANAM